MARTRDAAEDRRRFRRAHGLPDSPKLRELVPCATSDCPGDGRYTAPGRGHRPGCRYPLMSPDES